MKTDLRERLEALEGHKHKPVGEWVTILRIDGLACAGAFATLNVLIFVLGAFLYSFDALEKYSAAIVWPAWYWLISMELTLTAFILFVMPQKEYREFIEVKL